MLLGRTGTRRIARKMDSQIMTGLTLAAASRIIAAASAQADQAGQRIGHATHMSIWKGGKPLFAGNGYAGLSEPALFFIGGVFSDDQIDAYMELKWEEVMRWETTPSPVEYDMYCSA
jgi:glutamine synthetase